MTTEVIIGKSYRHDTGIVMEIESATVPCEDEEKGWITMIEKSKLSKPGFVNVWRNTWEEFLNQWTMLTD